MKNFDLIWARDYSGITQTKIAEIFGVSRRTVINWEQGHTKLPPAKFKYLLSVLDIAHELVPQNTQPEPGTTPVPAASPAPTTTPVVSPAPTKRGRGTWVTLFSDGKDASRRVLGAAVRASDAKDIFDVYDLLATFMRTGGPADDTTLFAASRFIYGQAKAAQGEGLLKAEAGHEYPSLFSTWSLTQAGWQAFDESHVKECREEFGTIEYDEGDCCPILRETYPNAHNRLFGDLV